MTRDWTEEGIAAHVDGALDPREDVAIRRAIETDPEARATAERLRRLNAVLAAAYPLPGPEAPPGIAAALSTDPGRVSALPPRRHARWAQLAAAASVALAVGIGAGLWLGEGPRPPRPMLAEAGPALETALETLASGTLSDAGVRPLSTFRDAKGRPCREFETADPLSPRTGIACRLPEGGWDLAAIVAVPEPAQTGQGGFAPASGPGDQALDMTLDALGAGLPIAPAEEAVLLRSNWQGAAGQ